VDLEPATGQAASANLIPASETPEQNKGGWASAIRNKIREARDRLLGDADSRPHVRREAEPVAVSPALVAVPDLAPAPVESVEPETVEEMGTEHLTSNAKRETLKDAGTRIETGELQTSTSNAQRSTSNPSRNSFGRTSPLPSLHSPGDTSSGRTSPLPSPQGGEGEAMAEHKVKLNNTTILPFGRGPSLTSETRTTEHNVHSVKARDIPTSGGNSGGWAVVSSPKRTVSLGEYQKAQAQVDVPDATLGRLPSRLKKGARASAPEPEPDRHFPGWTPLHFAAFHNQLQDAYFLLVDRADPRAVSGDKKTPIDLARAQGHADMVTLLEKRFEDLKKNTPGVPAPGW
jgi:hypothetical protein